jgi:hypothetical protein
MEAQGFAWSDDESGDDAEDDGHAKVRRLLSVAM